MDDPFARIARWKRRRDAVILAHYYQDDDIQDLADFVGDSLQLAREATRVEARVIVFCGVHFMAETAKVLNPEKTVLLPDLAAGCSLAESCEPRAAFLAWRRRHAELPLVTYVNTPAWVKAESDLICTSSNARAVVESLPPGPLLFAPDRHLARYVAKTTGRELIAWPGVCIVHDLFEERRLWELQRAHPGAKLAAHPECPETLLCHADYIGSTKGIIEFCVADPADAFIIATEPGVIHQMRRRRPDATYLPLPPANGCACNHCPHMRLITLDKVLRSLETMTPAVEVEPELARRALVPLERMLALGAPVGAR